MVLGDNVAVETGVVIKENVQIGMESFIGANTYIGEGAPYEAHMRMITYPTASSISDVGTTEATGSYGYNTDLAYNSAENCYLIVFRDNSDEGWGRVVINNGSGAGQTVFHLHLHILSGRTFGWPPG